MEKHHLWTPPVNELSPEDIEAMQVSIAEMEATFKVSQDELRTNLAMERAQVSAEEWDTMHPLLKGIYTQNAVDTYNYEVANRPRDGRDEYSVFL